MREIKFRIPHYDYKGNFKGFSYWGRIEKGTFATPASYSDGPVKKPDEQYTGLKDKNGKEIYEGDIIDIDIDSPVEVFYHDRMACYLVRGGWLSGDDLYNYIDEAEIIGNIHETPELIK